MGFLDSVGELLGGFHDLQMENKYGPDWRVKKAAEDFALQQKRAEEQRAAEKFSREQENADVAAASMASLGGMSPDELGATLPASLSQAQRKMRIARALGESAQSKSALASTKAYTDRLLQGDKDAAAMAREQARGEIRQKLLDHAEEIRSNQQMSPREKQIEMDRIQQQLRMFGLAEEGRNARALLTAGRPQLRPTEDGYSFIYPPSQQGGGTAPSVVPTGAKPPSRGAAGGQTGPAGMASTVLQNIADLRKLANSEEGVTNGPIMGRISKLGQQELGPSGNEGEFDFKANALVDLVYMKSGKQINDREMEILKQMIPNRARGNINQQIDQFEEYANRLLSKYGVASGEAPPGVPKKKYRLKPGANPDLKSSYEEVP